MQLSEKEVIEEALKLGLSNELARELWEKFELRGKQKTVPRFVQLAYYLGTFIIVFALSWFFFQGWELFGGGGMVLIAIVYAGFFIATGNYLWNRSELQVPGGLFYTLAVCMAPLIMFGAQLYLNMWNVAQAGELPDLSIDAAGASVSVNRLLIEMSTIFASLIALRYVSFAFLSVPLFAAVWFMSLDIAPILFGPIAADATAATSAIFGVLMLLAAYMMDHRTQQDYAFWGYCFGLTALWTGLIAGNAAGEWWWFKFLMINMILLGFALILERRIFIVFGVTGIFLYLAHLAYEVFQNSIWLPFTVSLIGLGLIFVGVFYQRHEKTLQQRMQGLMSEEFRKMIIPHYRRTK